MSQRGPIGINGASSAPEPAPSTDGESQSQSGAGKGYEESPRKPKSEREAAFDWGAWLVQGLAGISEELRHNDLGLPEEFWVHAYAARKEALLAARALVDAALEKCAEDEKQAGGQKKKPPQRGQVSIDFS